MTKAEFKKIIEVGTYNFAPSIGKFPFREENKMHFILDMKPWYEWGNSPNDMTSPDSRKDMIYYLGNSVYGQK